MEFAVGDVIREDNSRRLIINTLPNGQFESIAIDVPLIHCSWGPFPKIDVKNKSEIIRHCEEKFSKISNALKDMKKSMCSCYRYKSTYIKIISHCDGGGYEVVKVSDYSIEKAFVSEEDFYSYYGVDISEFNSKLDDTRKILGL